MHKLGISLYPEHSTAEKDQAYMEVAAKYGFTRIFTCLLSVKKSKEEIIEEFSDFMKRAHALGFEVAVDTNPEVFKHLGATPLDLKVFHDMQVDIIRLDGHFDDFLDRAITHNEYQIKIEFNGSADSTLDYLLKHGADPHNVIVCHNFYPERYSGISWKLFMKLNEKWKSLGLRTAAFVSSNEANTFGPWPVSAGLPTVEVHRKKPIDVQVRHMLACELIDDILIGNTYASEDELKAMSNVDLSKTTIKIQLEEGISEIERKALFNYPHTGRQDASDYYIRSSLPRFFFKEEPIPARSCEQKMFHRGDVVVVNDNLMHYRGEVEIILMDIENDGERNLVAHICEDEHMILEEMEKHPEHMFGIIK
ncbi:DUF871 domain-containing protein [Amedibacillus sp. YH-ame10]